jgi:hypothetical protein
VLQNCAQAHQDNGIVMDFAFGPNQGTGVPAPEDSDGLMWDIAAYNISIPIGSSFDDILPGWGSGQLQAAVAGTAIQSESRSDAEPGLPGDYSQSRTQITLAASSLVDVTDLVGADGQLSFNFPSNATGLHNTIFAIYVLHSHYRAQDGPDDLGGPQTAPQSFVQNGSWAVDHFSALGASTMTNFWEQYILTNGTRELLQTVGHHSWEDSNEIGANVYWTKNLTSLFETGHGYSIQQWLPILFHRNGRNRDSMPSTWWVTDEVDGGNSHIADYRQTLGSGYQTYLSTLNSWTREYLGLQFSTQISYNLPMDMLASIPYVDEPECESLDFSDLIDGYRQYSGPAYFTGKPIVSSECGAVRGESYTQTLQELMWKVKRSYAGGVNQFVFHGYPYSGSYPETTWPVYTTFTYAYSNMHGPHEPAWDFYRDHMDFVARNNFILQTGVPKMDIVFWQKLTTYPGHITQRTYQPTDLEQAGYSYGYLSPDNFDSPLAVVQDGVLASDAQAFRAIVVRASDSMTTAGVAKLVEFASAGLPIIMSGGIPSSYLGTNSASSLEEANGSLQNITTLPNVHVTEASDLAPTLSSIGIVPYTELSTNSNWYTMRRHDNESGTDYIFIYNDAAPSGTYSSVNISFSSTGYPYVYNAWTGEITQILTYSRTGSTTTILVTLAGYQSTIIGFSKSAPEGSVQTDLHLDYVSSSIYTVTPTTQKKPAMLLRCLSVTGVPCTYTNADGKFHSINNTIPALALNSWTLTVEHWDPPSNLTCITCGATKHNTTHTLTSLIPWSQIAGLENVSGRGYYNTTFTWPLSTSRSEGAILSFGAVYHTLRTSVNGHSLPPLDITDAKADIGPYLIKGVNVVEAVVSTPLGNVLRSIWNELRTSGSGPSVGVPAQADYGLRAGVSVIPYAELELVET